MAEVCAAISAAVALSSFIGQELRGVLTPKNVGDLVKIQRVISLVRPGGRKYHCKQLPSKWKDSNAERFLPKEMRKNRIFINHIQNRSIGVREVVEAYHQLIQPLCPVPPDVDRLPEQVLVLSGLPQYPVSCILVVLQAYLEGFFVDDGNLEEGFVAAEGDRTVDKRVPWRLLESLELSAIVKYGPATVDAWFALQMPYLFLRQSNEEDGHMFVDFELSATAQDLSRKSKKISTAENPADSESGAVGKRHFELELDLLTNLLDGAPVATGTLTLPPTEKRKTSFEILGALLRDCLIPRLVGGEQRITTEDAVRMLNSYRELIRRSTIKIDASVPREALACPPFMLRVSLGVLTAAEDGALVYVTKNKKDVIQFVDSTTAKTMTDRTGQDHKFCSREMTGDTTEAPIVRDTFKLFHLLFECYGSSDINPVLNYLSGPPSEEIDDAHAATEVLRGATTIGRVLETSGGNAKIFGTPGMTTAVRFKGTAYMNVEKISTYFSDGGHLHVINYMGQEVFVNASTLMHINEVTEGLADRPGYCYRDCFDHAQLEFHGSHKRIAGKGMWEVQKAGEEWLLVLKKAETSGMVG